MCCKGDGLCTKVIGHQTHKSCDVRVEMDCLEEMGMRVLIVEDDAALGLFLQKGLKLEGHDVAWVGDGETGLQYAEEHRPDLIVLDLSLPRKDGTEVLEAMRGRFDGTAVLVLTGRSQVEERGKCLKLGPDDCPLKPVRFHYS